MQIIQSRIELDNLVKSSGGPHYLYVLRHPDGIESHGAEGTPFYVGIGQGARLFSHEIQAKSSSQSSRKLDAIRQIWRDGKDVVRTIEGVYSSDPLNQEEALIRKIGRLVEGTGPLTNDQIYAPSDIMDGVQLRKYAAEQRAAGGVHVIPENFKFRYTPLDLGQIEPKNRSSVFGKIYSAVEASPKIRGEDLIYLLQGFDFSNNKSVYTENGRPCAIWLARYIEGAFYQKNRHLKVALP